MKTIILSLVLMLGFGAFVQTEAQTESKITVKVGKQKRESRSRITVKFLSLVEDSRCPTDVQCIQAGNARIKVQVSMAGSAPEILEMNTMLGARGGKYDSYAINLTSLTPSPKSNVRLNRNAYTATFTVVRLSR